MITASATIRITSTGTVITRQSVAVPHPCHYVEQVERITPVDTVGYVVRWNTCTVCGGQDVTPTQARKNRKNYRNARNRYRRINSY